MLAPALVLALTLASGAHAQLSKLVFENEGVVLAENSFTTFPDACNYLEPERPTKSKFAWAVEGTHAYTYMPPNSSQPSSCKPSKTRPRSGTA